MKNNNDLKVDFANLKILLLRCEFLLLFIITIAPTFLIYFLAPDKLPLMFKMPFVFFLVLPISFFLILVLSFFIKIQNGITKMEIKHDHFFMTVYDKNKTRHNLSIPIKEVQNVKILVTQIIVYTNHNNTDPYLIIATDRDKTEASQDATLIYQLVINLKNGKSFNIIDEIPVFQLGLKYFLIPRLLPNFSYEVKDIYELDATIIKQRIDTYVLRGKSFGIIGYIWAFLTSKKITLGAKILFLFPIFAMIFLAIVCLHLGYFIIGFLS